MAKILVVDDEPEMIDILKLILEDAGHKVYSANNGQECLNTAEKEKFDLIFMDIRMPRMDGWETLRRLKEKKLLKGSKVIVLTVEKGPGVEIFGLQDIVDDYITKPFDKDVLLKNMRNILR
ncbi:MAG: response regulator [Candidatus Altiarchaeota archaeon]|nr:response regulator [Candidatus Altiarchaeota archaeon]